MEGQTTPIEAVKFSLPKPEDIHEGSRLLAHNKEQLREQRFTVFSADIIIPKADRLSIAETIFTNEALELDRPNINKTRRRADDSLSYGRRIDDGGVDLAELPGNHPDSSRIRIQYKVNHPEERDYKRVKALDVQPLKTLIETVLDIIPEEDRRQEGQYDVHAFRTSDTVVHRWHKDGDEETPVDWVLSYVVAKTGSGAVTQLARDAEGRDIVREEELGEGQLIMHTDKDFYHNVTGLSGTQEAPAQRDALIMTIRPKLG